MKQVAIISIALTIVALAMFVSLEADLSKAATSYATTTVTLIVDSEITLTASATVAMWPNISLSQDTSVGSSTFNVETSDTAGYTLDFSASTSPALHNGTNSFADYTEGVEGTPESWSVDASAYEFGFSAYGGDVDDGTWDSGATACGTPGAEDLTSSLNWMGFNGTTAVTGVASSASETSQDGTNTVLCVAAEQGSNTQAPSGTYVATLVGTATTQ